MTKKERSPNLSPEMIRTVLDLIDSWKGKLTWPLLLPRIEEVLGHEYSRFTFNDHPEVANAFTNRKEGLKGNVSKTGPRVPRDEKVRAAHEQVERLKAKVNRLQAENDLLVEQFVTWALNAERAGVSMAKLNAPLVKPNRDRSKGIK